MHKIAPTCANNRTIAPALALDGRDSAWGIPIDQVPGKLLDGRLPREVDVTEHVERDYYAGAFQDLRTRTTSTQNFVVPIYFQPALMQRTRSCLPELDDDDVADMVAIVVPTQSVQRYNPISREDDIYYRLYVDLYRPTAPYENGGVYSHVERVPDTTHRIKVGPKDTIGMGDTIFVSATPTSGSILYRVVNDDYPLDAEGGKTVDLDPDLPPLPDELWLVGWVIEEADFSDTMESVLSVIETYEQRSQIQPPIFSGVCGPLQPVVTDFVLLQYMLLLTGNAKIIVDYNFYNVHEWKSFDHVEMRLGYPITDRREYDEDTRGLKDRVARYEVRYRNPHEPDDPDWAIVWRKVIGTFIIEGSHAWNYAAYVLLDGPGEGVLTVRH